MAYIFPTQKVQMMDVKNGYSKKVQMNKMFQIFADDIECISNKYILNFNKDYKSYNIKITDLYGWTNVLFIMKQVCNNINWKSIKSANKEIIVSDDTLIPTYDINHPYRGFHGEVKYPYILKNPEKLSEDDWIRLHRAKDKDGNDIEFGHPIVYDYVSDEKYGYFLITKSRFGNINDIQILLDDHVTIEETGKWIK